MIGAVDEDALDTVERHARDRLPAHANWVEPTGYPDSLALCAIDAVYSLQARYEGTVAVVDRYRALRRSEGADPERDGATALLEAIDRAGGSLDAASTLFGNQSVAPGTERRKSEALTEAVGRLRDLGIETTADLRAADQASASRAWRVHGLGWVSFDYLLMNAGVQGVKADTMVVRFVTEALGAESLVDAKRAGAIVRGLAERLGTTQRSTDYAIWDYQRRQEPGGAARG